LKQLQDILANVPTIKVIGDTAINIAAIRIDSRAVVSGDCFVAIKGNAKDAHQFIDTVIAQGATSIVCSALPAQLNANVTFVLVQDTSAVLGLLAANFYDHPSTQAHVVGITGTNGKTTTATLGYQLLTKLGYQCGLISTVHNIIGTDIIESTHTTPDAITVQQLLRQMVDAGCAYIFMEVSSHAVVQHRIKGIQFDVALFSNITHDHLDYHGTFENYIKAKKQFFDDLPATAFAITNLDDKRGAVMLQNTIAQKRSYAFKQLADFKGKVIESGLQGLLLDFDGTLVHCKMIGEFNAYNLLAIYSIARCLDISVEELLPALSVLPGAEGRFEVLRSTKQHVLGIVDYAHTPDALLNVLATINKMRDGQEKVFTVIGCGGDRDKAKRPIMADVACQHSHKVVLTSDNPRTENAQDILDDMQAGVQPHHKKKYLCIADRKEAIRTACMMAEANDIVLVAGKGHEKYQDINGIKHPFDDKKILQETFETLDI
jgi:UDP-N-acetylmuramoyl-L-alanyl-D-glutamate--2,6-diaminopimelate ligase